MTNRLKNYLGVAIIVSVLVLAFSAWSYVRAYSQSIQPSSFRSFSVSGVGKVVSIPDVAEFTFSVITEGGKDIGKLEKENTDKINATTDFIKSNGVDKKDIKTTNYNLNPRYENYNCYGPVYVSTKPCPPPTIVGYTINQTVQVKVRDFSKVGDVLGGVVEKGANSVSQLSFTIDDPTLVQNQAREEAIQKAKEEAKSIARAGGFGLGRLLSIDENGGYNPPMPMYRSMDSGFGGAVLESKIAPSIEPGSEETQVSVTLRYEIK